MDNILKEMSMAKRLHSQMVCNIIRGVAQEFMFGHWLAELGKKLLSWENANDSRVGNVSAAKRPLSVCILRGTGRQWIFYAQFCDTPGVKIW